MSRRVIQIVDKRKRPTHNYAELLRDFLVSWNMYHNWEPRVIVICDNPDGSIDLEGDQDQEQRDLLFNCGVEVCWIQAADILRQKEVEPVAGEQAESEGVQP